MIKYVGASPRSSFIEAVRKNTDGLEDQNAIIALAEGVFIDGKVKGWFFKIDMDKVKTLQERISNLRGDSPNRIRKALKSLLQAPSDALRRREEIKEV